MSSYLVAAIAAIGFATVFGDVKFQSVDRKINLNSQFARVTEAIRVKNTGDKPVETIDLCQARHLDGAVAFYKVNQNNQENQILEISPKVIPGAPVEAECWSVSLSDPVPAGGVTALNSSIVLVGAQQAYPAEVAQGEAQLMLFLDNVYVLSPYQVSSQTTEVTTPNSKIRSHTQNPSPATKTDNKLKYGKYELVKPWSLSEMRLHFDNPRPFRQALSLVRDIEVSHWGNIYVEENYELKNAGAQHKGPFSRLKYSYSPGGRGNAFREMKARLPAKAHSLYYVDLIGNISTSDVRKTTSETIVEFETRYPLLGGWKADFKIGYSTPLDGFLFRKKDDGKRRLVLDFGCSIDGVYVEDMTIRIALPEGSTQISSYVPHDVEQHMDTKFSYLDTIGRPVVVLHKKHVVPEHSSKYHIDYAFAPLSILREPLLLIASFAALFGLFIAYSRLDLTITKDGKWYAAQDREKVKAKMQQAYDVFEGLLNILVEADKLMAGTRTPEDADDAQKKRPGLDSRYSKVEAEIKELVTQISQIQPGTGEKVREIQEKARAVQQHAHRQLSERIDAARKGASASAKKPAATAVSLEEECSELSVAIEAFFGPY